LGIVKSAEENKSNIVTKKGFFSFKSLCPPDEPPNARLGTQYVQPSPGKTPNVGNLDLTEIAYR